jgi:hypothetical protein
MKPISEFNKNGQEDDKNGLPPRPRRNIIKKAPTSTELLKDFITRKLPDLGSMLNGNHSSNDERADLMEELRRDFFISPQDRIDDLEDENADQATQQPKPPSKSKLNLDNYLGPDVAADALQDASIRRAMLRRAATYIIERCRELDLKREAEIKARGDEKEIEAWFNGPRYHDKGLLWEARNVIEDEYVRPVRDEQKRRKYY